MQLILQLYHPLLVSFPLFNFLSKSENLLLEQFNFTMGFVYRSLITPQGIQLTLIPLDSLRVFWIGRRKLLAFGLTVPQFSFDDLQFYLYFFGF